MQIKAVQIKQHVNEYPCIWISGDDAYQNIETCDQCIEQIQQTNNTFVPIRYYIQSIEELERFKYDYLEVSLFGEQKLYLINLQKKITNSQIKKIIAPLIETPNPKHKLIFISSKLDKALMKTKWYSALSNKLLEIVNWPVKLAEFDQWLIQKSHTMGLKLSTDAKQCLSRQTQGNLLACKQVLDLLVLLHPNETVEESQINQLCQQSSQYQVYDLEDAILKKQMPTAIRICARLSQTESDPTLVIWIIWQNIRIMYYLHQNKQAKEVLSTLKVPFFKHKQYINQYRQFDPKLLSKTLELISQVDQMAKSSKASDVWIKLEQIIKLLCKQPIQRPAYS